MLVGNRAKNSRNGDCCGSNPRPLEPHIPDKNTPTYARSEERINNENLNSNSMDDLAEDAVICILSFLSRAEISACRCLNRRLNALCSDDRRVWLAMCQRRWGAKTEVKKWGRGEIRYNLLYDILDKWENLVGFWRGVGHGGLGPLVIFDWGARCVIGYRIIPSRVGSYEVRKVPFLWIGVSAEGKGLCFIDPDWLPDSALCKNRRIERTEDGSGLGNSGCQSLAILDIGSGSLEAKDDGKGRIEVGVNKIRDPFENWEIEDLVAEGLASVNLNFVGNCHIVVEENEDRNWVKNCQFGRSSSYWDLSRRKSKESEDGHSYGSLPNTLQSEIYQYFASKVSLSGDRSARKQRRKEKEKASQGRRKWEAEHFVKVVNYFPTPVRPLQGLWKGIFDSMSLEFILVSYDEYGGIVCRKVGGYSQNISGCGSVFWTANSTSFTGLPFSSKEEELYNSRTHIRPLDDIQVDSKKCCVFEEVEVTRVLCINSDSAIFRNIIGVSATSNMEGRLWQYTNGKFGFGFLHSNSIVDFKHIGSSGHLLDVV